MPVSLANSVYARTTSVLTPSSTVSASRSPGPGILVSTPPPGSGMRALGGGGPNNAAGAIGPEVGDEAEGACANVRGCGSTTTRARPTPATVAAASDPRNL